MLVYQRLPEVAMWFFTPSGPGSMQQLYAEYSEIFISVKENTRRVPWEILFLDHDSGWTEGFFLTYAQQEL